VSWLLLEGRDGWAFTATTFAMATIVISIFSELYPRVMVSSTNATYSLTVSNASSSPYTLKLMTVVAVIFLPLVLLYQGWTYYVFRKRISTADLEHEEVGEPETAPSPGGTSGDAAPAGG
jgi:cytochrome d ubiquinol oxidase subunit II